MLRESTNDHADHATLGFDSDGRFRAAFQPQEAYAAFAADYAALGVEDQEAGGRGALSEGGNGLAWLCKAIAVAC